MDDLGRAMDLLDPPPRPELAGPVAYAEARSRGQFRRYRHLEVIEHAITEAIATGGRLIVSASVRHGKSTLTSRWLPAWYLGTHPDRRVILGGHESDFARSWGRGARDILREHGPADFDVSVSRESEAANRWDIAGHAGGMLTIGTGGSPIGRGADLMIIDDPTKSYGDAMSPLVRERVKTWWAGTMASRVEPGGAVILVMARWHQDDLAGWLMAEDPGLWHELRLPALCDDPDSDPMGRALGEPLWPERWPLEALEQRRQEVSLALGEAVWSAQYQGLPQAPGGGMFTEARWTYMAPADIPRHGLTWTRGWDLAASHDTGDWTVGARMGRLPDGRFIVADVVRGQWDSRRVQREMLDAADRDPHGTRIELPQDPGAAGKAWAQQLVSLLAGQSVYARPQTGSKEVRATGYAAQQQAGNVVLVEGSWNGPFIAEHAAFPRGTHDDQVDAAASAFNALVTSSIAPVVSPGGVTVRSPNRIG